MSVFRIQVYLLLFSMVLAYSCGVSEEQQTVTENTGGYQAWESSKVGPQIAEYIRNIFQDKGGNLWFGTNGYGVAYYDGDSVSYFSNAHGFHGQQITDIAEDPDNNIWFATNQGVVKYEWSGYSGGEKQFTNYSDPSYFGGQQFWSVLADSKGLIWAGSATGIFRFDGVNWEHFELPYPEEVAGEFITGGTSWSITEDRVGNIWFSTNGYGAFKYDGQSFTQYTEEEGLTDNRIDIIIEDSKGNIWFGTRYGGVSRFDGESFVNFSQRDGVIGNDEVCVIYEDKAGDVWFSSEGYGVYRYDSASGELTNYSQNEGLQVRAVQTIFEDREGRFWVGGGGGLYRYDQSAEQAGGATFINVTKDGPWE